MKKLIATILLLLVTVPAQADYKFMDGWDWKDTTFESIFIAECLVDMGQTLDIAKRPELYYEKMNFLLPRHPTTGQVIGVIGAGIVIHALISMALPPHYEFLGIDIHPRLVWQSVSIGLETGNIINNSSIGLRVNF